MSKSIYLSEEAYERLEAHKRQDETFSEVVLRLAGERSLLEIAGILDDDEADALRDAIDERRTKRRGELEEPVLTRNVRDFERLGVAIETY